MEIVNTLSTTSLVEIKKKVKYKDSESFFSTNLTKLHNLNKKIYFIRDIYI